MGSYTTTYNAIFVSLSLRTEPHRWCNGSVVDRGSSPGRVKPKTMK